MTVRKPTTRVETNNMRVTCTKRSELNVRSSRGENWLLASWSVTTVRLKVRDVRVTSEPEMAASTDLAASGPPVNK
jgi:hypothetical protein